jgi:hypothetical protein
VAGQERGEHSGRRQHGEDGAAKQLTLDDLGQVGGGLGGGLHRGQGERRTGLTERRR